MIGRGRVALGCLALTAGLALAFCSGGTSNPTSPASKTADTVAQATAPEAASKAQERKTPEAPPPAPTSDTEYAPERAAGAVKGVPAPTNTAPIVAVANYFTELPGIDLASLPPRQKERLLQRVNSELCTCGCRNDTLARCYVNDPRCPVVKGMVQRVYDEVKNGK